MKKSKIALVQMESKVSKTNYNLSKIKKFVEEASKQKVDIICFPELSVHGYTNEKARKISEAIYGNSTNYLRRLAIENNITILSGLYEKSKLNNCVENIYITQLVCFKDGSIDKYQKTHLGERESKVFTAGEEIKVFETDKFKFGVQICFDTHFPELSTIQSLKGAEIIFTPHASPSKVGDRRNIWLKYLTARAYDNSVYIACCNAIGDNGENKNFAGGTLLIDPKGNIEEENFSGKEGMLIAELNCDKINNLRCSKRKSMKDIFYLNYRKSKLYKELLD